MEEIARVMNPENGIREAIISLTPQLVVDPRYRRYDLHVNLTTIDFPYGPYCSLGGARRAYSLMFQRPSCGCERPIWSDQKQKHGAKQRYMKDATRHGNT